MVQLDNNSDPAVKQMILNLDREMGFIIEDLDETHLFIGNSW